MTEPTGETPRPRQEGKFSKPFTDTSLPEVGQNLAKGFAEQVKIAETKDPELAGLMVNAMKALNEAASSPNQGTYTEHLKALFQGIGMVAETLDIGRENSPVRRSEGNAVDAARAGQFAKLVNDSVGSYDSGTGLAQVNISLGPQNTTTEVKPL